MNSQEKLIARFLRQEQTSKKIVRYVLRYAGKGRTGHTVEEFEIVEALPLEDLDRLAESIYGRSQMDADGMGPSAGPYRYTVTSVENRGGDADSERDSARVAFRVKAQADLEIDGDDEGGEETPNMRGMLAQLMRHNEANNRTLVGMFGTVMVGMGRREEKQSETIERLLDERTKMLEIVENAKTEQLERQLVAQAEERKQNRIDFGVKKLALLAPVALNYFTDGKMGSGADTPQMLLVKELMESMTPEQMQTLIRTFNPAQQAAFFKLYESMQAKKTAEIEAGKDPNGTPLS